MGKTSARVDVAGNVYDLPVVTDTSFAKIFNIYAATANKLADQIKRLKKANPKPRMDYGLSKLVDLHPKWSGTAKQLSAKTYPTNIASNYDADFVSADETEDRRVYVALQKAFTDQLATEISSEVFRLQCHVAWQKCNESFEKAAKDDCEFPAFCALFTLARSFISSKELTAKLSFTKEQLSSAVKDSGATTAEPGGGGAATPGPGDAAPPAPAPAAPPINEFLARHTGLYFDSVEKGTASSAQELSQKILAENGLGATTRKALVGFLTKVQGGTAKPKFADVDPSEQKVGELIAAFKNDNSTVASFGGFNITNPISFTYNDNEQGLIEFLRFAYVIKRPGGEATGAEAAQKIGIKPLYSDGVFARDPTWQALSLLGAIIPVPFFKVIAPEVGIPAGSEMTISVNKASITATFGKAKSSKQQMTISIGATLSDSIEIEGARYRAQFTVENAKILIAGYGKPATFKLSTTQGVFTADGTCALGTAFDLSQANPGPRELPTSAAEREQLAQSLSGEERMSQSTIKASPKSPSRPFESNPFELGNVYLDKVGVPKLNAIKVVLQKRISGKTDIFKLTSQDRDNAILIPVTVTDLELAAADMPDITALAIGTPPAAAEKQTIAFYPVRTLEWQFMGNYRQYGPDAPDIGLVDFEPVTDREVITNLTKKGINIKTQLDTGLVQRAAIQYIRSENNPVGTALYRSQALNYAMNRSRY